MPWIALVLVSLSVLLIACAAGRPGPNGSRDGADSPGPATSPAGTPAAVASAPPAEAGPPPVRLPPAQASRTWEEFRLQAARRIVAANPEIAHTGPVREPVLAIPVLEIEIEADGAVRRIQVLRRPPQAPETVQMAIEAVRRAAPFGDVSRLPPPWRFTEAFLFDDQRRLKPRSLDPL
jgi:hypothetical protein